MSEKKGPSVFRKILNVLFNIFWAIFGGLGMALSCIGNGIMTCLMIIPIFFGIPLVHFRMVGLAFAPAGKSVKLNFSKAPVRNVFYWIFGGFASALWNYVYGALLCLTIIGILLGLQQFKFAKYFLAPFGARVLKNGQDLLPDNTKKAAPAPAAAAPAPAPAPAPSKYDDLAKLKTLLDSGVITQEEFDAKKKEILNS